MAATHDDELLTIDDTARLLKVSRMTVHRWLKAGRLAGVRVGPKAVRIRRGDLVRAMQPLAAAPGTADQSRATVHPDIASIPPPTDDEVRRTLAAIDAARALGDRIRARLGDQPLEESWPIIREAREERSRRLL
jgi:excisionase family DNA binding protein